jgi:hypothetical protein
VGPGNPEPTCNPPPSGKQASTAEHEVYARSHTPHTNPTCDHTEWVFRQRLHQQPHATVGTHYNSWAARTCTALGLPDAVACTEPTLLRSSHTNTSGPQQHAPCTLPPSHPTTTRHTVLSRTTNYTAPYGSYHSHSPLHKAPYSAHPSRTMRHAAPGPCHGACHIKARQAWHGMQAFHPVQYLFACGSPLPPTLKTACTALHCTEGLLALAYAWASLSLGMCMHLYDGPAPAPAGVRLQAA